MRTQTPVILHEDQDQKSTQKDEHQQLNKRELNDKHRTQKNKEKLMKEENKLKEGKKFQLMAGGEPKDMTHKVKYCIITTGNTLNSHEEFLKRLHEKIPDLMCVSSEQCDVVLVFCPIVSRAGTDIEAALKIISDAADSKPAVLVVLHHTFNRFCTVPDSRRSVTRENTTTVDCLFHEDYGFLNCLKNDEALKKVVEKLKSQEQMKPPQPRASSDLDGASKLPLDQAKRGQLKPDSLITWTNLLMFCLVVSFCIAALMLTNLKFCTILTGKTLNSHEGLIKHLHKQTPDLQEVSTVEECDVILLFCPIVSMAGTEIEAALKKLNETANSKPAVLVVLHHTFDPDYTVPDSSRYVTRENTTTVDCLFHQDCGLAKNLKKVVEKLKPQDQMKPPQSRATVHSEGFTQKDTADMQTQSKETVQDFPEETDGLKSSADVDIDMIEPIITQEEDNDMNQKNDKRAEKEASKGVEAKNTPGNCYTPYTQKLEESNQMDFSNDISNESEGSSDVINTGPQCRSEEQVQQSNQKEQDQQLNKGEQNEEHKIQKNLENAKKEEEKLQDKKEIQPMAGEPNAMTGKTPVPDHPGKDKHGTKSIPDNDKELREREQEQEDKDKEQKFEEKKEKEEDKRVETEEMAVQDFPGETDGSKSSGDVDIDMIEPIITQEEDNDMNQKNEKRAEKEVSKGVEAKNMTGNCYTPYTQKLEESHQMDFSNDISNESEGSSDVINTGPQCRSEEQVQQSNQKEQDQQLNKGEQNEEHKKQKNLENAKKEEEKVQDKKEIQPMAGEPKAMTEKTPVPDCSGKNTHGTKSRPDDDTDLQVREEEPEDKDKEKNEEKKEKQEDKRVEAEEMAGSDSDSSSKVLPWLHFFGKILANFGLIRPSVTVRLRQQDE
ncbi:uncharacterized protein LOC143518461 isoform X2 [Brachyhypopomus gauderio]